jgi:peptidoglycan/xylan/chitin deacetylase (PgdA/CDA1 family)
MSPAPQVRSNRSELRGAERSLGSLGNVADQPGALVISLDFELHWGARDHTALSPHVADTLLASRAMVVRLADLFAERGIRATWATVGLLFARSAEEANAAAPSVRPRYVRAELDPYAESIGDSEDDDPLRLAGTLVDYLSVTEGQEVASHTFSHFYCLERGPDDEAFRADLAAAQEMAGRRGLRLRSLVLPRNQWRDDLAPALLETGFECFRGPQPGWANRARRGEDTRLGVRAARFAGSYVGPSLPMSRWDDVLDRSGLCNIPATTFLRPFSPATRSLHALQRRRVLSTLRAAAGQGQIAHLWWHPQNFATHPEENMGALQRLLDEVDRLRASDGLRSMSMGDVNEAVRLDRRAA